GPWSARYDLGPSHPLTPRRFGPGIELLSAMSPVPPTLMAPEPASDDVLAWVHDPAYIRIVRRRSESPFGPRESGLGPGDTPTFPGMHDASAAIAGGSVMAIEAILSGETTHAFHPGGGLHHAMSNRASGFCVYDDPALAIARARRAGLRVLYIDLDVHHGDGVQAMHWDDPGVLTFSIHESGRTLFPGTGFIDEVGEGEAAGTAVNLPLDPETGEDAWLGAIEGVLPGLAAAFGPDLIVSQHGADAHAWDPLANLRVTTTAMGKAARLVDAIAHRWASGRWLATGGGGYDAYRVVPRMWTLVWLAAQHAEQSGTIPEAWRSRWAADSERYGQSPLPMSLEDMPNAGLTTDSAQVMADCEAARTAAMVRELVVPALLRTAQDSGWWSGDLVADRGTFSEATAPSGRPQIHASVDAATWESWTLAPRTLPLADASGAHALVLAALKSADGVRVTAAVVGGAVVGAIISAAGAVGVARAASGDTRRRLIAVGVAPAHRRKGFAAAMLRAHLAAGTDSERWEVLVTLAERDPIEPLARMTRERIARRLLDGAGFAVTPADGRIAAADPGALEAHRG
ncbi:MAG: acetoin utilization protein AcuC, partial [Chloroflexota bacterium]